MYGVLANVAADYLKLIGMHGNTMLIDVIVISYISPLNLLGNTPNFVDK